MTGAYTDNQRYTEQNPAYPPQGQQQPVPQGLNSGPAVYDSTQPIQGPGYGAGGSDALGRTHQGATQVNQGQYGDTSLGYGAPGAGGHRIGDPAIPPANIINLNPDNNGSTSDCGGPSLKGTIGKIESAVGSMIGSNSLKAKGLQKKQEVNAAKIQAVEITEAERLEKEAMMRRERAVAHGAHPANAALGGKLPAPGAYN